MTIVNRFPPLPKGWIWTQIQDISETTSGGTPSRKNKDFFSGEIPWLKSGELADNLNIDSAEEAINQQALDNSSAKIIPKGSLLVALYGATVGKLGLLSIDAAINQAICAIEPNQGIYSKYLFYYLSSYRKNFLNARKGGAQPNISQEIVKTALVPLAPTTEQLRIIRKVEELFSFLDAGVESLRKVQAQLKRYRQAVLKYAFEGKLTEECRRTHKDQTEVELKLFESMTTSEDSYEAPKEWSFTVLSNIAKVSVGHVGPVSKYYTTRDNGIPMLSTANISDEGLVRLDEINYVNREFGKKNKSKKVYPGDIIVARHGDSGSAARIPDGFKEAFCLNAVIVRPTGMVLPRYLETVFRFKGTRSSLLTKKSGSVQSIVGTTALKQFKVPLPSLPEQNEIVERLELAFSIINATESIVKESLRQSAQLRQCILKAAFEGRLVPQDPNDEPAEKLLERIKAERFNNRKPKTDNQLELSCYVK